MLFVVVFVVVVVVFGISLYTSHLVRRSALAL